MAEPLGENAIALITAPGDPAADGTPLAAAELAGRAWLLREPGSGTRTLNEQFLAERGLDPTVLELGSNGAIKQAARAGLGVSLLSRAAVESELATGRLSELLLADGPRTRPWYVLRSTVGPDRPTVEHFMAFVRERGS
jgi:DNA-binding transcriptional LysR family regulator